MPAARFNGKDCTLSIRRESPGVVAIVFAGNDVGEFGDGPFRELEKHLSPSAPIELFIDARPALVSGDARRDYAAGLAVLRRPVREN